MSVQRESHVIACGRCGAERMTMRIPGDWSDDLAAKWLELEERFVCRGCAQDVIDYYGEAST